jgi:hypothetical protein
MLMVVWREITPGEKGTYDAGGGFTCADQEHVSVRPLGMNKQPTRGTQGKAIS